MGSIFCIPHKATVGQIKTPVQCVENHKGSGGVIIFEREMFTMNKQHLVAVCDHKASYYNKIRQARSVVMASEDNKVKCLPRP